MNTTLKYITLMVALVCICSFTNSTFGKDKKERVVLGKIVEIDAEQQIIQVKNQAYTVTNVFIDDGSEKDPKIGSFSNLKEGNVVEVHFDKKEEFILPAKKVILYKGVKEELALMNMK